MAPAPGLGGHAAGLVAGLAELERWEVGLLLGVLLPTMGAVAVMPHQQERAALLGCGPVCLGSITSARSFCGLVGAPLVGALSDSDGRRVALAIGALANALSAALLSGAVSVSWLYLAMIPGALLAHNFTVAKAATADHCEDTSRRAAVYGRLGVAAGAGILVGPVVSYVAPTLYSAAALCIALQLIGGCCTWALLPPGVKGQPLPPSGSVVQRAWGALRRSVQGAYGAIIRADAAGRMLACLRLCYTICFHIFYVFSISVVRQRHGFTPADFHQYYAVIGGTYALAQLCARPIVDATGGGAGVPSVALAGCTALLCAGRMLVAVSATRAQMYAGTVVCVSGLGVLNVALSSSASRVAPPERLGGLMGGIDLAEKVAGVIGPFIGGLLFSWHELAPVAAVCSIYAAVTLFVLRYVPRVLGPAMVAHAAAQRQAAAQDERRWSGMDEKLKKSAELLQALSEPAADAKPKAD
eukprot:TRINITY_DN50402_c0_g1_i1.p1 TRINITY_DN50402_c0_g1~~TRINITY_DN50402_c0_g1_i1.p1  ORF type:complete len:495 (+),score=161.06 TRINITY_DN50402_c0_g1_i1:78-1487(+)